MEGTYFLIPILIMMAAVAVEVWYWLSHSKNGSQATPAAGGASAPAAELRRLERGLYPTCEVCGERIEIGRLRADPGAVTCERHAAQHARAA